MKVDLLTPKTLFDQPVRYVVPDYQRKYVWEQEKQWEPLLDDVLNLAEQAAKPARRSGAAPRTVRPHFMGSIILMPMRQAEPATRVAQIAIVDGQQRLLTLQLMLDAAQQECENRHPEVAQEFTRLVLQRPEDRGDRGEHNFKIRPTDHDDQIAFLHAMQNDLPTDAYEKERIVEAHKWFAERIGQWLDRPSKTKQRAVALYSALAEQIQVAAIELGDEDDEQIIFETLNSRGTELGTFELVKNFLLREAREQDVEPGNVLPLLKPFDQKWWSSTTGSGRARRPHVEAFLHHWLTMETTQEVKLEQTFRRFREHVSKTRNGEVERVAEDLAKFAGHYHDIQTADRSRDFGEDFVRRWKVLQTDVFTPLILWLWEHGGTNAQVDRAFDALESYMVRRLICSLDTRGYGAMALELLELVRHRGRTGADKVISEHLALQRSERELWPTDTDVVRNLVNSKLLGPASAARTRMILEAVEQTFRKSQWRTLGGAELAKRPLSVEHIMPRHWQSSDWARPKAVPASSGETADQVRNRLVHSIGNLTLVHRRYNSRLSDAAWTGKRVLYREDPEKLALTADLLHPGRATAPTPSVWDEEQIRKRSERLAKRVIRVWPRPS